jgi:NADP-dependent 3-hydroxy acid dehydrogenase YdfG
VDKVVLVSGAARGLGLVQAEALLEAGATGMFIQTSWAPIPQIRKYS